MQIYRYVKWPKLPCQSLRKYSAVRSCLGPYKHSIWIIRTDRLGYQGRSRTHLHRTPLITCGHCQRTGRSCIWFSRGAQIEISKAVWALGNIAGDSPACRDIVLQANALRPLLTVLNEQGKLQLLRNATWTLSNFCRGKNPQPDWKLVSGSFVEAVSHLYLADIACLARTVPTCIYAGWRGSYRCLLGSVISVRWNKRENTRSNQHRCCNASCTITPVTTSFQLLIPSWLISL